MGIARIKIDFRKGETKCTQKVWTGRQAQLLNPMEWVIIESPDPNPDPKPKERAHSKFVMKDFI